MNKSIESLKKKAERKKERLENLLMKFSKLFFIIGYAPRVL